MLTCLGVEKGGSKMWDKILTILILILELIRELIKL
ncbi:hypothetical protein CJE0560 [Campylobacter jejuni RM1221]|uniref:Uncharacterized protein n=1 Tax=Campylobacter phage vB_CJ12660_3PH123 TaxID=3236702 RepID=A0AB39C5J4_9VIRU|nr:hypothetical protein CJE0560 [Campylobacter jejuni RM1221]AON68365.1 hypothetical protein MTVDSCj16_0554 [Campylobacter jejuni subsp. jejuni]